MTQKKHFSRVEMRQIQETLEKEKEAKRKIPEKEICKINYEVFKNISIAIAITVLFNFIILGFMNIENSIFIVDLKVFSMSILITSIIIFEYAYKKDSGTFAIYGIEVLVLSLVMLSLIYLNIMLPNKFISITVLVTYVFAIYYVSKSIIIYKKMKKEYLLELAKEIIKK